MLLLSATAWTLFAVLVFSGPVSAEPSMDNKLSRLKYTLPSDRAKCFTPGGRSRGPSSHLRESRFDCTLGLFQNELQFEFSRQRVNAEKVKDPKDLPEYLSGPFNTLMRSSSSFPLDGEQLKAEVELGYSAPPSYEGRAKLDDGKGMTARLSLKGKWEPMNHRMKYWAEHFYYGSEFENINDSTLQDRSGVNIGTKWYLGMVTPKMEYTRFQTNVERDSREPKTIDSKGKLSLAVEVPEWPTLTLTYKRRMKETSRPNGKRKKEYSTDTVSGELWYERSTWEAYVTSSYSYKQKRHSSSDEVLYDYTIGGSYWPIDALTVEPFLEFSHYFYPSEDYREKYFYASLDLDYSIMDGLMTTSLLGEFTADQTTDGEYHTQGFKGSLGLARNLGSRFGLPDGKLSLTTRLTYRRDIDLVYHEKNTEDYTALFLFEFTP